MATGKWEGVERRRSDATVNEPILAHIDKRFDEVVALLRSAFPNGDIDGHRRTHEGEIKTAEKWSKIWQSVLESTLKMGVWAGVVTLATLLWSNFKDALTR